MPNIEMYGLTDQDANYFSKKLKGIIDRHGGINIEIAITAISTHFVYNLKDGKSSPFLRIWDTDIERAKKLADIISIFFNIDIECPPPLLHFIPAKQSVLGVNTVLGDGIYF